MRCPEQYSNTSLSVASVSLHLWLITRRGLIKNYRSIHIYTEIRRERAERNGRKSVSVRNRPCAHIDELDSPHVSRLFEAASRKMRATIAPASSPVQSSSVSRGYELENRMQFFLHGCYSFRRIKPRADWSRRDMAFSNVRDSFYWLTFTRVNLLTVEFSFEQSLVSRTVESENEVCACQTRDECIWGVFSWESKGKQMRVTCVFEKIKNSSFERIGIILSFKVTHIFVERSLVINRFANFSLF